MNIVTELTCGCNSGSRMWASSEGRWLSRMWVSWPTHVSNEVTMVSSSGTLTSSDMSSFSISSTGSSRNSWPPTTSKKCSWWKGGGEKKVRDQKRKESKYCQNCHRWIWNCWWQSELKEGKKWQEIWRRGNEGVRKVRQTSIQNTFICQNYITSFV